MRRAQSDASVEPAAHLELLLDRAAEYARRARSENTVRAYLSDVAHFERWCDRHVLQAMPAEPSTLAAYLAEIADQYRPSTITRRLSAISIAHQQLGHVSPTTDPAVRTVARGVRRTLTTAVRSARPVSIGDLRAMIAHTPSTRLGLRDRAVLLVGFAGALRRSELVAIMVDDLEPRPEGLVVHLRRSKTDPEGEGREIALPRGTDAHTCPVRTIARWRDVGAIVDGPLFRRVDRHGNVGTTAPSAQTVGIVVKRAAERAGIDPSRMSGHSLRAGFVTTAAASGASEASIARTTGHKSMSVLRTYVRHATVFTDNAASSLGL